MASIHPYLTFNGNCEEAFTFYKSAFGGEFLYVGRMKDMPPIEGFQPPSAKDAEKIMHISLPISKESILLGSDDSCSPHSTKMGNNIAVSINAHSKQEADKLFHALSAGGNVTMPMADAFWGAYFGTFTDKFGIHWMINHDEQEK